MEKQITKRYNSLEYKILDYKVQQGQIKDNSTNKNKSVPNTQFASQKKNITPPVNEKIKYKFNTLITTGLPRLDGIIYNAKEDQEVKAIFNGKVAFADWIRGMGMVVIIEHGNDYVSIYGNNDSLLVKKGDTVKKNENITISSKEIYFAIRLKDKALNPLEWLKY